MQTKTLTEAEVTTINERFQLDLKYSDATHYRAAQVIWSLNYLDRKPATIVPDPEADPDRDNPPADQVLEDIS